ncbi:MAG TPA: Clp protease N-terminal domain-containing protein, partial [Candidatus Acidoferrales bacterium]|nr:Clp protease N-terminal domain-containing protein [Candidatus Acidoferrales bacterium]
MDLNRLTEKSQEALRQAQSLATRRSHQGVEVEHLLTAMIEPRDGLASSLLQAGGINVAALRERLQNELNRLPQV